MDHRQPEAGTAPDFFGCEEGFEGSGESRLVHAGSRITDRHDDVFGKRQFSR
jgi:hypothetical protein